MLDPRALRIATVAASAAALVLFAACGGGGASKTSTPALSAEEASTATVLAAATETAAAREAARATAAAGYAALKIRQAEIQTGATPDPSSTMPTFIMRLLLDNQTGKSVQFVGEFVIRLSNGAELTYGSYLCSRVIAVEAPEGMAEATMQACTGDRGTPIPLPDAVSLAQGAALVRARLIFEGDVSSPWYTPSGELTET